MRQDHYEMLEVSPRASLEVIEAAYRVLAKRHHPDRAAPEDRASSEERMRNLNEARDVLRDSRARREYDRSRKHGEPLDPPPDAPPRTYPTARKAPATPAAGDSPRTREDPAVPSPVPAPPGEASAGGRVGDAFFGCLGYLLLLMKWGGIVYLFLLVLAVVGWLLTAALPALLG